MQHPHKSIKLIGDVIKDHYTKNNLMKTTVVKQDLSDKDDSSCQNLQLEESNNSSRVEHPSIGPTTRLMISSSTNRKLINWKSQPVKDQKITLLKQRTIMLQRNELRLKSSFLSRLFKRIEGERGSGVHFLLKFYFKCFCLNFFLGSISLLVVILPFFLAFFDLVSYSIVDVPLCGNIVTKTSVMIDIKKIRQSEDVLKGVFYGTYIIKEINEWYDYRIAYCSVFLFSMCFIFFFLSHRGCSINDETVRTENNYNICFSIFAGYEFSVTDNDIVNVSINKILTKFECITKYITVKEKKMNISYISIIFPRVLMTIFSIIYYIVTGLITYYSIEFLKTLKKSPQKYNSILGVLPTTMLTILRLIFQYINDRLIKLENYDATLELFIYTIRIIVFYAIGLILLLHGYIRHEFKSSCWESSLGFTLTMYLVNEFIFDIIKYLCVALKNSLVGVLFSQKAEFRVAPALLCLYVCQTVTCIGIFFSPWICIIMSLKLLINLLILPVSIQNHYLVVPLHYKNYEMKFLLDLCLWILYIFGILVLGLVLTIVPASHCGLFTISNCQEEKYLLDGITNTLLGSLRQQFIFVRYVCSSSFMFLLMCILGIGISYSVRVAKYYKVSNLEKEKFISCLTSENKMITQKIPISSRI